MMSAKWKIFECGEKRWKVGFGLDYFGNRPRPLCRTETDADTAIEKHEKADTTSLPTLPRLACFAKLGFNRQVRCESNARSGNGFAESLDQLGAGFSVPCHFIRSEPAAFGRRRVRADSSNFPRCRETN